MHHLLVVTLVASALAPAAEPPATWAQWRGPTRDCKVALTPAWPSRLTSDNFKQIWHVDLQPGYSGPIVSGDRVFVVETRDKSHEVVRSLDRATGREIWKTEWPGAMTVPFFAASNGSWVRATPAFDGESLYVAGMRDLLVCLDTATGKVRWQVDFMQRDKTELPAFGFASSPLVDGEFVYVQAGAAFVKLDKKTGATVWRVLQDAGGMNGSAFSSPFLTKLSGKTQILVQTRAKLAGVDPQSGAVLWSQQVPTFRGMNILTPTVYGESVFTSAYGGKAFLYQLEGCPKIEVKEAWVAKAEAYMSSPVLIGDHAYLHLRNQRFTCLDLRTGKECWISKEIFGKYWSMASQNDRILALDEKGELILIHANPTKFEIINRLKISKEETWGHIAVCGNEVFVRDLLGISAYRWGN